MGRLPRVYVIRHGETEWSKSGQYTGKTDKPLLPDGEAAITKVRSLVVGPELLLNPANVGHVFLSPRIRAQRTFELLLQSDLAHLTPEIVDDLQEWDYGDYEGIHAPIVKRANPNWDIYRHGCPSGESPGQVQKRVDRVIGRCVDIQSKGRAGEANDIVIFTHGQFSRCLITGWVGWPMGVAKDLMCDPASITVLGYNHGSLDDKAIMSLNLFGSSLNRH